MPHLCPWWNQPRCREFFFFFPSRLSLAVDTLTLLTNSNIFFHCRRVIRSVQTSNIVARNSTFSLDVSLEGGRRRLALTARAIGRRLEVAIVIVIRLNVVFVACVYSRTLMGRNVLCRDCLPIIVVAKIDVDDFFRVG
jgi:hypothetical protein